MRRKRLCCYLATLLVIARVNGHSLEKRSDEHRESTAQILELEEELKRKAGENKNDSLKEEKELNAQPLPQIDGLASTETKKKQEAALRRLMAEQAVQDDPQQWRQAINEYKQQQLDRDYSSQAKIHSLDKEIDTPHKGMGSMFEERDYVPEVDMWKKRKLGFPVYMVPYGKLRDDK